MGEIDEALIRMVIDQIGITERLLDELDPHNSKGRSYRKYNFLEKLKNKVIEDLSKGRDLTESLILAKNLAELVLPADPVRNQKESVKYIRKNLLEQLHEDLREIEEELQLAVLDSGANQKITVLEKNIAGNGGIHYGFSIEPIQDSKAINQSLAEIQPVKNLEQSEKDHNSVEAESRILFGRDFNVPKVLVITVDFILFFLAAVSAIMIFSAPVLAEPNIVYFVVALFAFIIFGSTALSIYGFYERGSALAPFFLRWILHQNLVLFRSNVNRLTMNMCFKVYEGFCPVCQRCSKGNQPIKLQIRSIFRPLDIVGSCSSIPSGHRSYFDPVDPKWPMFK